MRPCVSVFGTRWTRCPPDSYCRSWKTPSPLTLNDHFLEPAGLAGAVRDLLDRASPWSGRTGCTSRTGRRRTGAASSPPVPARISTIRLSKSSLGSTRSWSSIFALRASCPRPEAGEFLLGHRLHVRVGLGREQRLGLLDLRVELQELQVRLDQLGEAAVLLGDGRVPRVVGRDGRVGELRFQLAELLDLGFERGPHGTRSGGQGSGREKSPPASAGGPIEIERSYFCSAAGCSVGGLALLAVGAALVLLLELLDPPGRVHELHLAGEERVAALEISTRYSGYSLPSSHLTVWSVSTVD